MNRLSPKPIIARVAQTWDVPLGMKYALVEDIEKHVWIVQSCPAGTQCWTVAQAAELPQTGRTGQAVRAAVLAGRKLELAIAQAASVVTTKPLSLSPRRSSLRPVETAKELAASAPHARSLRRMTRRDSKEAVCA